MGDQIAGVKTVASVGEVMIELVTDDIRSASLNVAGDTFNTAVYLARHGRQDVRVSYITALGTDAFSDRILNELDRHSIATDHIERLKDKVPGLYAIQTDATGERSFTYWRSDSAARMLFSPGGRIGPDALADFDLIYLSGITLAILPMEVRHVLFEALDRARASGSLIAYDSNYRPSLWESPETARDVNASMWARTDIGLPSVDDEIALFGDVDETAVLDRLRGYGLRQGALKRGSRGPLPIAPGLDVPDLPSAATVVDTTGAGDSFNAGFVAALMSGTPVVEALVRGHALATEVIGHRGAITPNPAQLR